MCPASMETMARPLLRPAVELRLTLMHGPLRAVMLLRPPASLGVLTPAPSPMPMAVRPLLLLLSPSLRHLPYPWPAPMLPAMVCATDRVWPLWEVGYRLMLTHGPLLRVLPLLSPASARVLSLVM